MMFDVAVSGEVQDGDHNDSEVYPQVVAENGDQNTSGTALLLYLQRTPAGPSVRRVAQST